MNTHVRERAIFVQSSPAFLTRLDAMIEELIAMRDALDGDPDFEPDAEDEDDGAAEPTLGAPERHARRDSQARWACGDRAEGEAEITMPTAGTWRGFNDSQDVEPRHCGYDVPDDDEDPHDAEADRADEEPTLGAPERHAPTDSQDDWAQGGAWDDEAEVTMPTASPLSWIGASQDVHPLACGYGAPDDAEEGGDTEPDGLFGDGRLEWDSQ